MPFGMMGSAMGMKPGQQKNKFQQVRDQAGQVGQGIGPSSNMMGGIMPGRRMGQATPQMMGGMMGGLGNAMGLGGFKQQRQVGGNRQMPFQPRQDMMGYGNTGMSNTQLPPPDQSIMQESNAMAQQQPMMQPQDPMQQALASYGPQSSLRRGIGPRFR